VESMGQYEREEEEGIKQTTRELRELKEAPMR
jgi:hypothetical protein